MPTCVKTKVSGTRTIAQTNSGSRGLLCHQIRPVSSISTKSHLFLLCFPLLIRESKEFQRLSARLLESSETQLCVIHSSTFQGLIATSSSYIPCLSSLVCPLRNATQCFISLQRCLCCGVFFHPSIYLLFFSPV